MAEQYTKQQLAMAVRNTDPAFKDYSDEDVVNATLKVHPDLKAMIVPDSPTQINTPVKSGDYANYPVDKNAAIAPPKTPMQSLGDALSHGVQLFAKPAVEQATATLGSGLVKNLATPTESLAGGASSLGQIAERGIETAGSFVGQMAGSEALGKLGQIGGKLVTSAAKGIYASENAFAKGASSIYDAGKEFLKKLPIAASIKKSSDFGAYIRDGFRGVKSAAGKEFETGMETLAQAHPSQMVDLSETVNILKDEILSDAKVQTTVNRIPKVKALLQEGANTQIPLQEAQEIKNLISQKLSPSKYKGLTAFKTEDLPVLDVKDNVNKAILSAFPDMAEVHAKYGYTIDRYNEIRKLITKQNLLNNMESNWNTPEIKNVINELMPPELVSEMGGYKNAAKFIGGLKGGVGLAAKTGIAGGAAYLAGKKLGLIPSQAIDTNTTRRQAIQ